MLLQSQEGHLLQAQEALRSGSNYHFKMESQVPYQVFEVCMYTSIISYGLNKGYNFFINLFASHDYVALPKMDLLFKERICSYGSKFFPLR